MFPFSKVSLNTLLHQVQVMSKTLMSYFDIQQGAIKRRVDSSLDPLCIDEVKRNIGEEL